MTTQASSSTPELHRDSAVPLYVQIAEALGREIAQGRPRVRLPSEAELMRRFGVRRISVRGALANLAKSGTVEARQGKGTFVAGAVVQHEFDRFTGFHDTIASQGLAPEASEFRLSVSGPVAMERGIHRIDVPSLAQPPSVPISKRARCT